MCWHICIEMNFRRKLINSDAMKANFVARCVTDVVKSELVFEGGQRVSVHALAYMGDADDE